MADPTVQRKLAQEERTLGGSRRLLGGDEDSGGDGQVVGWAFFLEVGWR